MPEQFAIRQEGDRVLVLKNGVLIADMPWQAALELSAALRRKAKAAEECTAAEKIIADQALLIRVGAPFGLTRNWAMLKESVKKAVTNRNLRRYLPGGIKSREVFGTPTIIQRPPVAENGKE
jgi:hypothetical protein